MSKLLLLTLNEQEEKTFDKIIVAIADCMSLFEYSTLVFLYTHNFHLSFT